ncbi:MAG: peptidoglycan binding protein CsiV, partial [Kangiellaceae bacterium]|nr:peptidoglycan binding protein CsiV [Kangiellaceae bacterium]
QQEFVPVALPWVPEIDGSMLVYIQRNYLHVDASLFYRRPDKEEVNPLDLTKSMLSLSDNYSPLSEATQEIFQQPRTITAPLTAGIISADQNNSLLDLSDTKGISEESIISDSNNIAANDYQNNGFGWEFNQDFLQSESEKIYITRLFNYPLKQTRRLRSGELHYFDHPLIGMLVMIRPYKRVLEDELESTDAQVSAVKITDAKQYMSHSTK